MVGQTTLFAMLSDQASLLIQFETLFITKNPGTIERENDPDHAAGPLFWLGGRASRNIAGVRSDVVAALRTEILEFAAQEPPFCHKGVDPVHLARYISLLSSAGYVPQPSLGLTYELPHSLAYEHSVQVVGSESEQGKAWEAKLAHQGIPVALQKLGFLEIQDFWKPWCMALHQGEIAAVASAARLSAAGAELGLVTVEALRGRGYAAAATCGWSRLTSLQSRALFYSADQTNRSSRRVIERLGLRLLGAYLRLT